MKTKILTTAISFLLAFVLLLGSGFDYDNSRNCGLYCDLEAKLEIQ